MTVPASDFVITGSAASQLATGFNTESGGRGRERENPRTGNPNRAEGHMRMVRSSGELAGMTVADLEGGQYRAITALCEALAACRPKDAAAICAEFLESQRTGGPVMGDPFGMVSGDAALWADSAPVHELAAFGTAALDRLRTANLGLNARKRLFAALWQSFPDQARKAFLARVDAEGRFIHRAAE